MVFLGNDLIITDANNKALIAASKSCTIETDAEMQEVTPTSVQDSSARAYISGRTTWSASIDWLVTAPSASLLKRGQRVNIRFKLSKSITDGAYPFAGSVSNVSINYQSLNTWPTSIYFDSYRGRFVGLYNGAYYLNWSSNGLLDPAVYTHPEIYGVYKLGSDIYLYSNGALTKDNGLQGTALVRHADIAGTWGSLSKGTWQLQGSGPLTAIV